MMSSLFLLGIFGSTGGLYGFHPRLPLSLTRGAQDEETAEHKHQLLNPVTYQAGQTHPCKYDAHIIHPIRINTADRCTAPSPH